MTMNYTQKIYILILGMVLGVLVFVFFIIVPLLNRVQESSQRLILIEQDKLKLEAQIAAIDEYRRISKEIKEGLQSIDKMFVDPQLPVDFVGFLEQLALRNNVAIDVSSVAPSGGQDKSLTFQLILIGEFKDMARFIAQLETSPYLAQIQRLQIQRLREGQEQNIQTNVVLNILSK